MNIADRISENARSQPDAPAILVGDRTISYREYDQMVSTIAARLAASGATRGEPVGVCLQETAAHAAAIYGVLRFGGILLPMDWRWTVAEQTRIVQKFKPRVILVEPHRRRTEEVAAIEVDEGWISADVSLPAIEPFDATNMPAILGLSSGTTGEPKAIVTTHAAHRARIDAFIDTFKITSADRHCSIMPFYFSASRMGILANMAAGGSVRTLPSLSSTAEIASAIEEWRATTVYLVPTLSRALLKLAGDRTTPQFPTLRAMVSLGAALYHENRLAIREKLTPNLVEMYASTGGSVATTIWPVDQDRFPDSVGRPIKGAAVQVVDESDQPLPVNQIGRVRYRAPGAPLGFYGSVSPGDEDFRNGWFYPGDFGSINEKGFLFLKGRRSDIVIRGGINIYTPEIERALLAHPAVQEAAVIGVTSEDAGEDLIAFVKCDPAMSERDLVQHCRTQLAAYKIPKRFHLVDLLPKNTSGKILKRELTAKVQRLGMNPEGTG
jgi:acyl-CoA synthetase (AMP-forming)/AMP-acid ligase II